MPLRQVTLLCLVAAGLAPGAAPERPLPITPLPVGDASVEAFIPCRLSLVSFRTPDEGWVSDMCGEIFRTRDSGRSWKRDHPAELQIFGTPLPSPGTREEADGRPKGLRFTGHLEFMHWFSASEALAGGYVGSTFFRTEDSGRTWSAVPVPSAQWVYALFARGDDVWACGSAGEIIRSNDRGRSWKATPTPFNGQDRCHSLHFDANHRGEATGDEASVWSTEDDGATWKQVRAPDPAELRKAHPTELGKKASSRAGMLRVTWNGLELEDASGARTDLKLRMASRDAREPMTFAERWSGMGYGAGANHFFLAEDGKSWHVQSELPATPVRRITFVTAQRIVLEAEDKTFLSEDRGRHWEPSRTPELDLADAARMRGEAPRDPAYASNPLECVAHAPDATLTVKYGTHGCFGGADHTLDLEVHGGKASLDGKGVGDSERAQLVADLGQAVMRPEEPAGCTSTTRTVATLAWSCAAGPLATQTLELETNACGSDEGVGASTSFHESGREGYARALGVYRVAAKAAGHGGK